MVKLCVNLLIAAWIFGSAFVLPHSTTTGWNAMIVAVVVAGAALLAFAAVGRPGAQYLITIAATWLFASAMILPHESMGTVLHDALVAAVLAFVTLLPSKRWARARHAEAPAA
jgi:hypothetical protein